MRILANKTNVNSPLFPYTYGRIRNNPGDGSGTPVNELLYGDMHQFFEALLNIGAITPNDLEENAANGYQTIFALLNIINIQSDYFHVVGNPFEPTYQNSFATSSYNSVNGTSYKKHPKVNKVTLHGAFQRATELNNTTVFTLPIAYRPTFNKVLPLLMYNNSVFVPGILKINATTGAVQVETNAGDGATLATYIVDGLEYALD